MPNTSPYNEIEKKWQQRWAKNNIYKAVDNDTTREKKYILMEFPYPSGTGLHVGHTFRYTAPDVYARYLRMKGYNVLFPLGWDAFGLPAEEYARKTGIHPAVTTKQNIENFKNEVIRMGYGFDWEREFATSDPDYYKWTQWIFGELFKKGIAVQKEIELWWCPDMSTVLANEEVVDGPDGTKISERGNFPVTKKKMKQWVLKMPEYAEKLIDGLEKTHYPSHVKEMQKNWIGKSEGVVVNWDIVFDKEKGQQSKISKEIAEFKQVTTTVAVQNQFGQFLVLKRSDADSYPNIWELPGGGVDDLENILSEAKREVYEESGIGSEDYSFLFTKSFEKPGHLVGNVFFFAKTYDIQITLSPDHSEYKWCNLQEAINLLEWDNHKKGIEMSVNLGSKLFDRRKPGEENLPLQPIRERSVALIKIADTDKFIAFKKKPTDSDFYNGDFYFLPGGGVDLGESALEAAIRETKEEIGLINLSYKGNLGTCRLLLRYENEVAQGLEHYFLFEISEKDFNNRIMSELDQKGYTLHQVGVKDLRNNNWDQLNYILDNLENHED